MNWQRPYTQRIGALSPVIRLARDGLQTATWQYARSNRMPCDANLVHVRRDGKRITVATQRRAEIVDGDEKDVWLLSIVCGQGVVSIQIRIRGPTASSESVVRKYSTPSDIAGVAKHDLPKRLVDRILNFGPGAIT